MGLLNFIYAAMYNRFTNQEKYNLYKGASRWAVYMMTFGFMSWTFFILAATISITNNLILRNLTRIIILLAFLISYLVLNTMFLKDDKYTKVYESYIAKYDAKQRITNFLIVVIFFEFFPLLCALIVAIFWL